jgi:hypothetical protein
MWDAPCARPHASQTSNLAILRRVGGPVRERERWVVMPRGWLQPRWYPGRALGWGGRGEAARSGREWGDQGRGARESCGREPWRCAWGAGELLETYSFEWFVKTTKKHGDIDISSVMFI